MTEHIEPGRFDPHDYDEFDLWRQTRALAQVAPHSYVSSIEVVEEDMSFALLEATVTCRREAATALVTTSTLLPVPADAQALVTEVKAAMHTPLAFVENGEWVDYGAWSGGITEGQTALARRLLDRIIEISATDSFGPGRSHYMVRAQSSLGHELGNMVGLTSANLILARIAGVDTAVFEAAADYAPSWTPDHVGKFSWLTGKKTM